MDLNKSADSLEEFGMKVEEDEVGSSDNHFTRKFDEPIRQCLESAGMSQQRERGISELTTLNRDCSESALLMSKIRVLEDQKAALEREVAMLRKQNLRLEEQIISSEKGNMKVGFKGEDVGKSKTSDQIIVIDDESTVNQLKFENDVLQFEKKVAETDAAEWKQKCCEMESRLLLLLEFYGKNVTSINNVEMNKVNPQYGLVPREEYGVPQSGNVNAHRETGAEVTPDKPSPGHVNVSNDYEINPHSRGRKRLSFEDTELSRKKVAPSTPAAKGPEANLIIDLIDSDEEQDAVPSSQAQSIKMSDVSTPLQPSGAQGGGGGKLEGSGTMVEEDNEEDTSGPIHFLTTPKRKRALKLVTSDSEAEDGDDEDDNVPLSQVFKKKFQRADADPNTPCPDTESADDESSKTIRRRRLLKMSVLEERRGRKLNELRSKTDDAAMNADSDDEAGMEDDMSANRDNDDSNTSTRRSQRLLKMKKVKERTNQRIKPAAASVNTPDDDDRDCGTEDEDDDSDGLDDFIVDDDDDADGGANSVADDDDKISEAHSGEHEHSSSGSEIDLDEILERFKRGGKRNQAPMEWEMVGDMLAAFGKDLELCMKAVCALCRRQTNDEQQHEEAFVANGRGFSKFDAARGTKLAKFLTNGLLEGDVKKSVDELRRYDPNGPELCRILAIRYSKQLFDIYQNEEDAYFRPPN